VTMKKIYKYCTEKNFTLFLAAFFITLAALTASAFGAEETFYVPAHWGYEADSAVFVGFEDGAPQSDSVHYLGIYGLDTAITVADDQHFLLAVHIYVGDSAMTWAWAYDNRDVEAGDATVDYDAMDSVFSAAHGSGAWAPSGIGAEACTVYVYRASDSAPLPGIAITAWDTAQTIRQGEPRTSVTTGYAVFSLDSGEVIFNARSVGYTFPAGVIDTVGDGEVDSIWGTWYSPDAPAGTTLCAVYGWLSDIVGAAPENRRVTFTVDDVTANVCDSTLNWRKAVSTRTDSTGYFTINLARSHCWEDTARYSMSIQGFKGEYKVLVPDTSEYRVLGDNQ